MLTGRLGVTFVVLASGVPLAAQVPAGSAVVVTRVEGNYVPVGLSLVDAHGTVTPITNLAPETTGGALVGGTSALCVADDGTVYAGLQVYRDSPTIPATLHMRKITLTGAVATQDVAFATLVPVAMGEISVVTAIKERADGSLIVCVRTQPLSSPLNLTSRILLVSAQGSVSTLTSMSGSTMLVHVADAGDRYVVAVVDYGGLGYPVELVSIGYEAAAPPPFRVHRFPANVGNVMGLDVDVDGDLIVGLWRSPESLVRIPHVADATLQGIAGGPSQPYCFALVPASGLVLSAAYPLAPAARPLVLSDTLAGTTTNWTQPIAFALRAVAVRADPALYGTASQQSGSRAWLGTRGGLPVLGNAGFGLRIGGKPGAFALLYGSAGRGNTVLPFGTFWLDLLTAVPLATATLSSGGTVQLPLPIPSSPALLGATVDLQVGIADPVTGTLDLSRGLEIVVR